LIHEDHANEPLVLFEQRGLVGLILLNDKKRRNALCADIVNGILDALEESRKSLTRALVIGSTQTAFCAGADIKEMLLDGWLIADTAPSPKRTPLDLFEALETDGRPIIAAVNGLTLGGGLELALACDIVVASDAATFALPEIGLGVIPNTAMARLPALVGPKAALDLIWTRRRLSASEAKELGIVGRIVEGSGLIDHSIALAESIVADTPPAAVAAVKHGINRGESWASIRANLEKLDQAEWQEGFSAFLDKRKPDYTVFWEKQARKPRIEVKQASS
jgi:enoyl-CoA hydratase/carnithine racemase